MVYMPVGLSISSAAAFAHVNCCTDWHDPCTSEACASFRIPKLRRSTFSTIT
jgi:hypothetical protein